MKQILTINLTTILVLTFSLSAFCQGSVTGSVHTMSNESLSFANILLLSNTDSTLIKGGITESDGTFKISVKGGNYILEVSMIGYTSENRIIKIRENEILDIGQIQINENATLLEGVTVMAKKVLFEKKIDRTVINVQANSINRGNTVLNVLRSSPGVLVGQDNIGMSGKQGVRVMINGKLLRMPIDGVMQMLEGMNASNVESIELITNPGAQYEAEGNAGFIDIILAESPDLGVITIIGAGIGMNLGINTNANANIQYRNRKLSINANYAFSYDENTHNWDVYQANTRNNFTSSTDSRTIRGSKIMSQNLNAGLSYKLTPKTEISFLLNGRQSLNRQEDRNTAELSFSKDSTLHLKSNISEPNNWLNGSASFGIIHKANDRSNFKVFYDNLQYYNRQSATYNLESTLDNNNVINTTQLKTLKKTPINFHVLSSDYEKSINAQTAFSTGARIAFSNFENQVEFDQTGFKIYDLSGLQSITYLRENIAAAYLQFKYDPSSKLSFEAGLRYEHTLTNIENASRENVVSRNYGNWFPTLRFSYKANESLSYQLVYNRRITRPTFNDLAPFIFFQNPSTLIQGNSQLLPATMDAIDFTISKGKYWISFQYARTNNFISFFTPQLDDMNNTIYSTQNLDIMQMVGLNLNNNFNITPSWTVSNTISLHNYKIEDKVNSQSITRNFNNLVLQNNQSIELGKNIFANLGLNYNHNGFIGLVDFSPQWMAVAGISKRYQNGSQLSIRINDIFSSYKWQGEQQLGNLNQSFLFDQNMRAVDLSWTMPIGNTKLKKVNIENGSANERARVN